MLLLLLAIASTGSTYAQTGKPISDSSKTIDHMKAFVVLVKVPLNYSPALAKKVGPQWEKTIADWKASGCYITSYAFPGESSVIDGMRTPVSGKTVQADGLRQVSNVLLRAVTLEEAVELAKACPVLQHGGSVEVREIPSGEPVIHPLSGL
jgi:hypothetical protein